MNEVTVFSAMAAGARRKAAGAFAPISSGRGGWWPVVNEPYTGAWQRNDEITCETVLESPALFSCITLIAGDIAKLRMRLVEQQDWGGWRPAESAAFSPVLRRPNRYQNHIQFKEQWMLSKLSRGNTYALKERDARGVVVRLYILDPQRVTPLVAPDSSVYYQVNADDLAGLPASITVPASEIIHDRFNCLFHPLVGISPIYAAGLPALQSLKIGRHWSRFFSNNAQPGGILVAPGPIDPDNAKEIKETWNSNYTGINAGKVAVIGDGMKYQALSPTAEDSQVIEQLGWDSQTIAGVLHVPAYKINVGPVPANSNVEALDQQYYQQCLQVLIESFEACMDEGLGLESPVGSPPRQLGVDLDLSGLLRMDTTAKVAAHAALVGAAIEKPNDARAAFDLPPVPGGDTPYLQVQNYSLSALDARDKTNPLAVPSPAPPAPAAAPAEPTPADPAPDDADQAAKDMELAADFMKHLTELVDDPAFATA